MGFIGFLSDFGLEEEWVASCKGVIYRIAPDSRILDISHEIPPFNVRKGALVLASALPYCPVGVYVAVVDPGVGGVRKPLLLKAARGDVLIGPDNGLLIPAAERLGGVAGSVEIKNRRYMHDVVSPMFHGRDIFAPVAAHVSNGADMADIGPSIDPALLAKMPWPKPVIEPGRIICQVIDIDRFGTLRLNIDARKFEKLDVPVGETLSIEFAGRKQLVRFVETFSDVPRGELLIAVDSASWLSIAKNLGNAAKALGIGIGDEVVIVLASENNI